MIKKELGRIKQIKLKEVFEKEDKDFTPWLNENIEILAEKLNIDIIDSSIEENVGGFYCDIIARDSDNNKIIIIENQFGTTNHDHLGKVLTYSAGKQASIIIWIAENFREEHKKALEWLNENVDPADGPSFFGIEIKLIQIEDSPPAPDFRIVVKPNDWERMIKTSGRQISETLRNYYKFYSLLIKEYKKINPDWRMIKPQYQSWVSFGAGKSGLVFAWAFKSNNRFAVELYIDTGDKDENERIFEELMKYRDIIENEIPEKISWEKLEEKQACRIAIYKKIKGDINTLKESDYSPIIEWGTEMMKVFSRVFSKYIKKV